MRRLMIIGAGGHGRSVAEAALASGEFKLTGFLDDAFPELGKVWDFPVLGKTEDFDRLREVADAWIVGIGDNRLREKLCRQLLDDGLTLATIVHPPALVSAYVTIGMGSEIMMGAIIGTEAQLGVGTIVNCGAVVDHQSAVADYGHLGVDAAMGGGRYWSGVVGCKLGLRWATA
jgi:sugar O-acyltransferase (sialic acid O-acetyltransferase NeuD family)